MLAVKVKFSPSDAFVNVTVLPSISVGGVPAFASKYPFTTAVEFFSAEFDRETAVRLVNDYYGRFMPAASISYPFIMMLLIGSFAAVVSNRTIMPRKMVLFNVLIWQLIFILIPDIHQLISPNITIMDYVMSQSSGNVSAVIMFAAQFVWLSRNEKTLNQ